MFFDYCIALIAGCVLDFILGDPAWLYHPVCAIGKYISFAEKKLRAGGGNLRIKAVWLTFSAVAITMLAVSAVLWLVSLTGRIPLICAMALLDWLGMAAKSLATEANGVANALDNGLEAGRKQVARIVGRDTSGLTHEEIIKAAVETVAENTTDAIISPAIYALIGGPVLMWGFKAASTLDSMVGYMDEKYRDIGWSSARLDDVLNWLPARLTALAMCASAFIAGLDGKNALRIVKRDHANHKSPNCAWSESAAAGALHIQLGGTHSYFGKPVYKPTIGDDDKPAVKEDIPKTVKLMYITELLMLALVLILAGGAAL